MSIDLAFPRDVSANLRWRHRMLQRAQVEPSVQRLLKEACRRDIEFFSGAFGWTYDPRPGLLLNHTPFVLWPYQVDLLRAIDEQHAAKQDLLVEKSRDMGATWCVMLWIVHRWLFHPAFKALCGSRKEHLVDFRGDMSTHFEIARYILRRLPSWMRPKGFDWQKHDLNMRLFNPELGNALTGEATNLDFSRQGRYSVIFLDEFASVGCDDHVLFATSDSTKTRLFVSTPKGAGNVFYRLRHSGKTRVVSIHWRLHPHKRDATLAYVREMVRKGVAAPDQTMAPQGCYVDVKGKVRSKWYDERCAGSLDPRVIAQELDIAYLGSGSAVLDLDVVRVWDARARRMDEDETRVASTEQNGTLEVYQPPQDGHRYVVGVDTAKGTGRDWSVAEVFEVPGMRQAAELHGQVPPDVLGPASVDLAHRYNDALLVCENDGIGLATCYAARDYLERTGWPVRIYRHVDFRQPNAQPGELGLSTGKCRTELIRQLMQAVRGDAMTVRSLRWLAEAYTFEWVSPDRAEATLGNHDDLIMATGFCLYALLSWHLWTDTERFWWQDDNAKGEA